MKVLHVLSELQPSGAEVMLKNSYHLWRSHGIYPEVLATGPNFGVYASELQASGYATTHIPYLRNPVYFWHYMRFLKRSRFDVVHQHIEGAGFWFGLAALLCGCRLIRINHANFRFEGNLRWRRSVQRKLLTYMGATFVAVGEGVRQNELERFGIDAKLVWNWADLSRFTPPTAEQRETSRRQWGLADNDVVIVTVGNCAKVKNHTALIEALASDTRLNKVKYLHVGLEDEVGSEQALAKSLGVAEQIVFTGWKQDAVPILHAADLFVMPSLFEGMSIATIEALASGLPAIISDVPGLKDFGIMFPNILYCKPTVKGLATRLIDFCSMTRNQRDELSKGYSEIAAQSFSPARGVAEYATLYRAKA
jgi:glycosyltransferase involved in cell wall biosynthesis